MYPGGAYARDGLVPVCGVDMGYQQEIGWLSAFSEGFWIGTG